MEKDSPLLGSHVVQSSIRPTTMADCRAQVARLNEMPSTPDPDFWKIIKVGNSFTAVRKLLVTDRKTLVNTNLLMRKHY